MAPSPSTISHPLLAYQPLSTLYKLYRIAVLLLRVPLWIFKAVVPSLRPLPTWTFKQALFRNITFNVVRVTSTVGVTEPLSLKPGKEGRRWTIIEPSADELYVGPLASAGGTVRPAVIGGTWYGVNAAPGPAEAGEFARVSLHIHGGAFVLGDGRQAFTGYLAGVLVQHAGFDAVLAPQYRLAGYGGRDPFPAALQDCLTAYLYLVRTLGIPASRITLSGDSAGGNLALGLLRYLERFGGQLGGGLPLPGRVVLISPWVNPSAALQMGFKGPDKTRTDHLPDRFLSWGANTYIRQAAGGDDDVGGGISEWVDYLNYPFTTNTPMFLNYADGEFLRVDCARWAEAMKEKGAPGWRFEVNVEEDAPHDTMLLGNVGGWEKSAEGVGDKIRLFVDRN